MTTVRLFLGAGIVALASMAVSTPSRAQTIRIMSGGGGMIMMGGPDGNENAAKKVAGSVSADSLTALKKFIAHKQPMIMLNGVVTPAKGLSTLKAPEITSVQMAEPTDGDLKYYGDKAKNGIVTITTTADTKKDAPQPNRRGRRVRTY